MKGASAALLNHLKEPWVTVTKCLKIIEQKHQPQIANISKANPAVVTTKFEHLLSTGDVVKIVRVRGMTQVNGAEYPITVLTPTTFSIPVNSTGFATYERGGVARRVIGFTTYFKGLTFENVKYNPTRAYVPTELRNASNFAVSNFNFIGILDSQFISDFDIERGLYSNCEMEFFFVNYMDLSMGKIWMPGGRGNIGQVATGRLTYEAEFKSFEHYMQQTVGHVYSKHCRAPILGYDGQDEEDTDDVNFCKVRLDPPVWQANTPYTARALRDAGVGSIVKPTAANGRYFECAVAGTSGATEPVWNTTIGATTVDGGVTWKAIEAYIKRGAVYSVLEPKFKFRVNNPLFSTEPDGWYRFGRILWGSESDNIWMESEIKSDSFAKWPIVAVSQINQQFEVGGNQLLLIGSTVVVEGSANNNGTYTVSSLNYNPTTQRTQVRVVEGIPSATAGGTLATRTVREIELMDDTPYNIEPGDQFEIIVGCDRTPETCRDTFRNIYNFRGERFVPGVFRRLQTPDAKA
ncbi:MAG TPA: DUF2163 domain-containing protein [Candidatus Acidoferrales bacterium]|nr:DUF2163 domain-containing protein [Candidatus Acidoferrales bacterium]